MYSEQMRAFLDGIAGRKELGPNGEDGRVVVGIVEAAYRARPGERLSRSTPFRGHGGNR